MIHRGRFTVPHHLFINFLIIKKKQNMSFDVIIK